MNCKNCNNEIKDDSRFCSFCGVSTATTVDTKIDNPLMNAPLGALENKVGNSKYTSNEKGYYIVGLVFFGLFALQHLFVIFQTSLFSSETNPIVKYLQICIHLAIAAIPILLSRFTSIKEHKNFLIIMGIAQILIGLGSSVSSLTFKFDLGESLPLVLGLLLYATPYALFIILLRKLKSKSWGQIAIRYIASTFFGIVLVFATIGRFIQDDYYGIAHLGVIVSYPIVNLIIGLIFRLIRRSTNKD